MLTGHYEIELILSSYYTYGTTVRIRSFPSPPS